LLAAAKIFDTGISVGSCYGDKKSKALRSAILFSIGAIMAVQNSNWFKSAIIRFGL